MVQLQDAEGFRLSVSSTDDDGDLQRVNTRGALVVEHENFITVTGSGFKPNSDAVAWLFSEPRRLGVVRVGSDGSFEQSLRIGSEVPVGEHTTQVNGLTASGEMRSLNLAVEVIEVETPTVSDTALDPAVVAPVEGRTDDTAWWIGGLVLVALASAAAGVIVGMRSRGI